MARKEEITSTECACGKIFVMRKIPNDQFTDAF